MDQTLAGDQTISSKGDIFELGFFKPGKSQNYYMGIWYKQLSERTVVWVANRETPLPNNYSSRLKIDQDGNLVLLNQLEKPIWSIDVSTIASNNTAAELLDTGNFVLRDGSDSSAVIWQSFDDPTDTWLPKGWFGRNMITGEIKPLISWKNHEDPALGMFSLQINSNGNDRGANPKEQSHEWRSVAVGRRNLSTLDCQNYLTYNPVNSSFIARALLDTSGDSNYVDGWSRPDSGSAFGFSQPLNARFILFVANLECAQRIASPSVHVSVALKQSPWKIGI
ncbi:hypothetical protein MRB53_021715 [Persea americana]|uniref:Uncharacterized protein n=1 Tax=Persea americana TaxID=3435 RepID=A0ACC2L5T2_PERAE|nr:hypothetical protein MRB53_021715 [Persea americana]